MSRQKGYRHREIAKRNIALGHIGIKYPNRKPFSKEVREQVRARALQPANIKRLKSFAEKRKGKSLEELYGESRADEIRYKITEGLYRRWARYYENQKNQMEKYSR